MLSESNMYPRGRRHTFVLEFIVAHKPSVYLQLGLFRPWVCTCLVDAAENPFFAGFPYILFFADFYFSSPCPARSRYQCFRCYEYLVPFFLHIGRRSQTPVPAV